MSEQGPLTYPTLTCADLDTATYKMDYLIPGVLASGLPCMGGGPHKSLKTLTLACDLGFSLAVGGRFLRHFAVSRPVRTAIMSGECGYPILQEYLRRIARVSNGELRNADGLLLSDRLPVFGQKAHEEAMGRFIRDNGLEVVIVDPAYLCLPSVDATNVIAMGAVLRGMGEVFTEHKTTLILLHHTVKPAGLNGEPIELSDLSFAGFREFAAQWLLLNRRKLYVPGSGHHELWLSAGGRAGHSGLWGLDVDEGEYSPGISRDWQVRVLSADAARQQGRVEDRSARDEERQAATRARVDVDKRSIADVMQRHPQGETRKQIRVNAGLNPERFDLAFQAMIRDGDVVQCEVPKDNRKTPYAGYKLAG